MATFTQIKKHFFELGKKEQEQILKELYGLSKENKRLLSMRFGGDDETDFLKDLEKATVSSTPKGYPKEISVRKVNALLANARKCGASALVLEQMELRAFEGYMTFLNDYGGGPDNYEDKVYDHLKNYLELVIQNHSEAHREARLSSMQKYLRQNTNMYYDHIWDLFSHMTGLSV